MTDSTMNENVERTLPEQETYTPNDIAVALYGASRAFEGAKLVRNYLRANFTRPANAKGKSWTLKPRAAQQTFAHFIAQQTDAADAVDVPEND